jgi:hypothetical protein
MLLPNEAVDLNLLLDPKRKSSSKRTLLHGGSFRIHAFCCSFFQILANKNGTFSALSQIGFHFLKET